jgi:F-box protein 21
MLNECSNEDDETILEHIRKDNSIKRDNVLQNINIVMYDVLRFKPAEEDDYYQLENSLIDKVLEKRSGIPITLSAVYQAIAYQLGVVTLPVNFPTHFLLKAPQNEESGDSEMYIDAYNNGRFLTQDQCLDLIAPFNIVPHPDIFNPVEPYQAIMRMVANIYSRSHQFLGLSINIARQWSEPNQRWSVPPPPILLPLHLIITGVHWRYPRHSASNSRCVIYLRLTISPVEWQLMQLVWPLT